MKMGMALCWLLAAAAPTMVLGQSAPSRSAVTVSGIVQDQSGAAIPNATVTLGADANARQTQTGPNGIFLFDNVSPGTFELQVEQEGFKKATGRVVVSNRPPRRIEFKLQIANLEQQLTVAGDEVQVNTQTDSNLDVAALDRNALDNAPIFDQNYISTISRFLNAGSVGAGGTTLIMDGVQVNSISLPASAIQEVKINQNPYSPEFLRPGRGRIEVVTKAGASAYHGTANFAFRDNRVNAREVFAATKPQEQRRALDVTLSGPLGSGKSSSFLFAGSYQSEDAQAIVLANLPSGVFRANVPQPQRNVDLSNRLTHQFGQKNTVSLRFESLDQYTKNQGVGGFNLPEAARIFRNREDSLTYTQTTTFTPRLVNDFRILFGKEYQSNRNAQFGPKIVVLDAFTSGGAQAERLQTEYHTTFHDVLSLIHGRQTLRMGVDVPDISRRGLEDYSNFQGTFTFSSLDDYLQNQPFSFVQQTGDPKIIFWEKVISGFFLDDVRVRPNLTLSLAARYDWQNYVSDHNNISPRIAFAFSPVHHAKTVFRGGSGLFYDRTGAQPTFDILRFNGDRLLQFVLSNPAFPNPWGAGIQPQATPTSLVKFASGMRIPYLLQWSFGVDRQLSKSTTLSVNYIGSETVGAFRSRDVNAPLPPLYLFRPAPNNTTVRQIESSGRAESHSLELTLRGDVTRFFSGLMQYTLARAYDNTSGINSMPPDSYDLSGEWARSDSDQRHRFNLIGTIKPAKLFTLGLGMFLNTGRPFNMTTGHDDFHIGVANARPAGVRRNTLQGPGYAEYDLRWLRDFKVHPPRNEVAPTVTVSVDAFNILNHTNYTAYVGNLSSPFYGRAVSALAPRRLQFSARYNF